MYACLPRSVLTTCAAPFVASRLDKRGTQLPKQLHLCLQVAVNTTINDVNAFLKHIVSSTNMKCLTPPSALDGECGILAADLYARSVFGEDALVNVSVEKGPEGKLAGYIRIRYTCCRHDSFVICSAYCEPFLPAGWACLQTLSL